MCKLEILRANEFDARQLAANMREDDKREVEATSRHGDPLAAILLSMRRSQAAYSVFADGELICMGGIIPGKGGVALGWMLSSKSIEKYWREFARQSREKMLELLAGFSVIYNYVDVRYIKAIRWLLWIGFRDGPVYAMAPDGRPAVHMSWKVG